jgi:flagellin-specific chaperone FliS
LRGSLDLAAGPVAVQLDQLYDFVLRRLMEGNMTKQARPTEEALKVLRGLLDAWQELAAQPAAEPVETSTQPMPRRASIGQPVLVSAGTYAAGGARR